MANRATTAFLRIFLLAFGLLTMAKSAPGTGPTLHCEHRGRRPPRRAHLVPTGWPNCSKPGPVEADRAGPCGPHAVNGCLPEGPDGAAPKEAGHSPRPDGLPRLPRRF